jgi:hypothetical protein
MMTKIDYQKRKNQELFKSLEDPKSLFLSNAQNYIPIYKRILSLNETNYNGVNLNHRWYLSSVKAAVDDCPNLFECKVKNIQTQKVKDKEVFFKLAPLLVPYKYLIGKYVAQADKMLNLPDYNSTETTTIASFIDPNNCAYVDGQFLYFTNSLIHEHKFVHGVDYYGSFLAVKNDFKVNVYDDIEFLHKSDFFNKNKNKLFKIDSYEHLFQNDQTNKRKPIQIQQNSNAELDASPIDDSMFEDIFEPDNTDAPTEVLEEMTFDEMNFVERISKSLRSDSSGSSCSSRSSYTSAEDNADDKDDETSGEDEDDDEENDDDGSSWDSDEEEEVIEATIPKFPVQVICMENCDNTLDDLIFSNDLTNDEWLSALMQIIMTLITYQKAFSFTHNDLHTNNVMYNETDKKFLFYKFKGKVYRVPTFGRIFKIIDFGRSIYKVNGKTYCSDSFSPGGDAATQYNTEPYFNEKKPRLEPNYSFDLCRLACSIFDFMVDDIKDVKKCAKDPVKKIIIDWCLDDKGVNVLYKNDGTDRYPDFKLYKMIARFVHNHTPQAQLDRPEFKAFEFKGEVKGDIMDIDVIFS